MCKEIISFFFFLLFSAATYLFPFLHLVAHVNIRGKIRDAKGIDGSGCNDFLIALFCPLCALVQEATEIRGEPLGSMGMARV